MFPSKDTVKMGRLSVETGMVVLYEIDEGVFHLTGRSKSIAEKGKPKPIREYIKLQGRFASINEASLEELQGWVYNRWEAYLKRASK